MIEKAKDFKKSKHKRKQVTIFDGIKHQAILEPQLTKINQGIKKHGRLHRSRKRTKFP